MSYAWDDILTKRRDVLLYCRHNEVASFGTTVPVYCLYPTDRFWWLSELRPVQQADRKAVVCQLASIIPINPQIVIPNIIISILSKFKFVFSNMEAKRGLYDNENHYDFTRLYLLYDQVL